MFKFQAFASENCAPRHEAATARLDVLSTIRKWRSGVIGIAVLLAACQTGPTPLPLVGNPYAPVDPPRIDSGHTYVYRYLDGFGNLAPAQVTYRVSAVGADRIEMAVTPESQREGYARTEIYTRGGNWLRHPLLSHNQPLDREFTPAYPAYVFPLAPGKSWSMRVLATNPANRLQSESVLVNGHVVGAERIRVAAGEFDTIKVRRHVFIDDLGYVGNFFNTNSPTHITETDWYAPELGRAVRSENSSEWWVSGQKNPRVSGDWNVYELAAPPASAP